MKSLLIHKFVTLKPPPPNTFDCLWNELTYTFVSAFKSLQCERLSSSLKWCNYVPFDHLEEQNFNFYSDAPKVHPIAVSGHLFSSVRIVPIFQGKHGVIDETTIGFRQSAKGMQALHHGFT